MCGHLPVPSRPSTVWLRDGPGTEKNGLLVAIFNPILSKPVFRGRATKVGQRAGRNVGLEANWKLANYGEPRKGWVV